MANYSTVASIFNNPNVLSKNFQDALSTQNVLIWWLSGKPVNTGAGLKPTAKKFTKELEGGSRFEEPVMLASNPNLKAYAKDATFNLTGNTLGDRAYYDVKSYGGPIPIYGFDLDVSASSKTNLLEVTKSFIEQANIGVANGMQAMLLANGGSEGANDWSSLLTLIAYNPTADSIGGISSALFPNWANQYKDAAGASIATYLKSYITEMMIDSTYGIQSPKLILMTKSIYGALHGQLVSNQRYVPDVELAKAGFKGMEYDGASVMFDDTLSATTSPDQATGGCILGINPESLKYGTLAGCNMKVEDFIRVPTADQVTAFIKHRGNMVMKDRRTNFHIYDFTTA